MTKTMTLFWHLVEVGLLLAGYLAAWTLAATLMSAADTLAFILGLLIAIVLLAALGVVGVKVWERTKAHLEKGDKSDADAQAPAAPAARRRGLHDN
jgi:hypothetical protein